jgi:hypothetical protein
MQNITAKLSSDGVDSTVVHITSPSFLAAGIRLDEGFDTEIIVQLVGCIRSDLAENDATKLSKTCQQQYTNHSISIYTKSVRRDIHET